MMGLLSMMVESMMKSSPWVGASTLATGASSVPGKTTSVLVTRKQSGNEADLSPWSQLALTQTLVW
jgi:hypothetical protein